VYRSAASAPADFGVADETCAVRVGLGVSDASLDFAIAANEAFSWLRRSGPGPEWRKSTIWTGAGAAILAAAEIEKHVVRQLVEASPHDSELLSVYDYALRVGKVAPSGQSRKIAFISAGAITNAALFMLARADIALDVEVWDDDVVESSNLNRYPLLDASDVGLLKVDALARLPLGSVQVAPVRARLQPGSRVDARTVVVGADSVAPRWEVARQKPRVAIVGSTDHYLTLTSVHQSDGGCPACLHPRDDRVEAVIPTISFVSFAAGLEVAGFVAQAQGGARYSLTRTWLRPDSELGRLSGRVPVSQICPVNCTSVAD
jgi:ThiF family